MNESQKTTTPTAQTTCINGCEPYYEVGGTGEPLVFVHGGFPSLRTALQHQEAADCEWSWEKDFAQKFQFIWYDRRGCYRSSCPVDGYELENQVKDLQQLLDVLGVESAHVIGSSAGGPISVMFAATLLLRIRSLVLVGTGLQLFPQDDKVAQAIRAYVQHVEQGGSLLTCRPKGAYVSFDGLWEAEEMKARGELDSWSKRQSQLIERAKALPSAERQRYYVIELQAIRAYMEADIYSYTRLVKCPTLVVHGDNDCEVPVEWGIELARQIPDARLEAIKGGQHSLAHRSPEVRQMIIHDLRPFQ